MEIAPNFTAKQWKKLDLDEKEHDWQIAINVLNDRLSTRYIEPVTTLIEAENQRNASERRFGFTILAIDLLLMETIQAFKEGLETTDGKSKQVFMNFLKNSTHFSGYFITSEDREKFYKEFRCGILHQAEVQSSALVWSIGDLYERTDGMEVLNRNAVHKALMSELQDYVAQLRDPASKELRSKFKKKMDFLAGRDGIA
ncbi:hypothetical protein QMX33_003325 [Yersinia ruckeri]|nr:hypothetical protein [Yersinia ruckeri]EKN4203156.1 hypothetical protein [Yersinia ruckeri]EKN4727587.1 hypothetical protein [Yersinia ruckeri]ELV7522108.1 hypothetical protein [Yersinia ruckeri]